MSVDVLTSIQQRAGLEQDEQQMAILAGTKLIMCLKPIQTADMNPSHWLGDGVSYRGYITHYLGDIIFGCLGDHLLQWIAPVSSPSFFPLFALFIPRKNGLRPTESGYESSLE